MAIPFVIDRHLLRGARWLPSPNCNDRPEDAAISLLVIHNISLPAGQFGGPYIEQLFTNCLDCSADPAFADLSEVTVSSHLLIDREGSVTQFVPFNRRAWHAGVSCYQGHSQCNDFSIGIELEGADQIPYTEPQYRVLAACCAALLRNYPQLTVERIVGHSDIAPDRKTDPGPAFDWVYFQQLLSLHTG